MVNRPCPPRQHRARRPTRSLMRGASVLFDASLGSLRIRVALDWMRVNAGHGFLAPSSIVDALNGRQQPRNLCARLAAGKRNIAGRDARDGRDVALIVPS